MEFTTDQAIDALQISISQLSSALSTLTFQAKKVNTEKNYLEKIIELDTRYIRELKGAYLTIEQQQENMVTEFDRIRAELMSMYLQGAVKWNTTSSNS